MRTNVYVDGFNLYHGSLQFSRYKWLNLRKLSENMLSGHEVNRIKFFTAKISARSDPDQPARQMIYWRALRTIENLEIIEGTFYETRKTMALSEECRHFGSNRRRMVRVIKFEEKGSDVNLASHLLMDAHRKDYEQAVIITNDSDLAMPIEIVTKEMGLRVGILNPHENHSKRLKPLASFLGRIRESDLASAQFDEMLEDAIGTIHKPPKWSEPPGGRTQRSFSWWNGGRDRLR